MAEHMEAAGIPIDVRDRLESTRESVAIITKKIRDGQCADPPFPSDDPIARLSQMAQQVSDACTKLVVILSHSPPPSLHSCGLVCTKVEEATLMLVTAYSSMSSQSGCALCEEVQEQVLNVLVDLERLISTLIKEGVASVNHLQRTGSVWKSCEAVTRLSKDNRSAVLKIFLSQLHLLKDACSEVTELQSRNGIDDYGLDDFEDGLGDSDLSGGSPGWTVEEVKLVDPCVKLIQLSVEVTDRSSRLVVAQGDVTNERCVAELDEGCGLVRLLSPAVDDLACELAAPVAMETCRSQASKLGDTLLHFIESISDHHYCKGELWTRNKFKETVKQALQQFS